MLRGGEAVLEAFKLSRKPHYKIYYNVVKAGGAVPCYESDPSGDAGTNLDRLKSFFDLQPIPGKYLIQFKNEGNDNASGVISNIFEIPGAAPMAPAISGIQQPAIGYTQETFTQILDAKVGALQKDFELKLLQQEISKEREELNELRKNDNALSNFLNNWAPMIVQVFAARNGVTPQGQQIAMAGFTDAKQNEPFSQQTPMQETTATGETKTTEQKLTEVLQWLKQAEGTQEAGVNLLFKMKLKAEQNPALLGMLKQFLN